MSKIDFKNKWVVAILALFGVSLISAGVFASASITLNSGNAVNLGAGAASVAACDSYATVSTQQSYDSTAQIYKLTTITLSNVDANTCAGKTLSMAFKTQDGTTYTNTWSVTGSGQQTLTWSGLNIDTAASGITTIAISAS